MTAPRQVQEYLDARQKAFSNPEAFADIRRALLASDKRQVLAQFESHLQLPDEEERARAIEGLALLYGREATETIIRWIDDPSPVVRWVACGCLHDCGDLRAAPALLDRLQGDPDSQVRGVAASALGQIGAVEALPELHRVYQTDHEVDELGHTPSSQALNATTSLLRVWVSRQIQGTPPTNFAEPTKRGELRGTVTAEDIPFDGEGRIKRTWRYSHLPISSFGYGWSAKLDLQTSLIAPFEIEVQYTDPTCLIGRVLVYQQIPDSAEANWAVHCLKRVQDSFTPASRKGS